MFAFLTPETPSQSSEETIEKIVERITNSSLIEDRRASVLALKG